MAGFGGTPATTPHIGYTPVQDNAFPAAPAPLNYNTGIVPPNPAPSGIMPTNPAAMPPTSAPTGTHQFPTGDGAPAMPLPLANGNSNRQRLIDAMQAHFGAGSPFYNAMQSRYYNPGARPDWMTRFFAQPNAQPNTQMPIQSNG